MPKIDGDLPTSVLNALAESFGFRLVYDRTPNTDEWILSAGHGALHVQHVGTRQNICAFLAGYASMHQHARGLLDTLNKLNRELVDNTIDRLKR